MDLACKQIIAFLGAVAIALFLCGCSDDVIEHVANLDVTCGSKNDVKRCVLWKTTGEINTRGYEADEDHHYDLEYRCKEHDGVAFSNESTNCSWWSVSGRIKTESVDSACFPGNAKVITQLGPKRIDAVQLGEEILGFNYITGKVEFTQVRAWMHRKTDVVGPMITIHTDAGHIVASPRHSIASGYSHEMVFAEHFRVGDSLVTPNGSAVVRSISQDNGHGVYAPLTWTSNFFVAGEGSKSIFLAHCFAHLPNPWRFTALLHAVFSVTEFFSPAVHSIDDSGETDYVHPVCHQLMSFGFVRKLVHFQV